MKYKIVYYEEYINDFGGITKEFRTIITSDLKKIEWYKNYEFTLSIEEVK